VRACVLIRLPAAAEQSESDPSRTAARAIVHIRHSPHSVAEVKCHLLQQQDETFVTGVVVCALLRLWLAAGTCTGKHMSSERSPRRPPPPLTSAPRPGAVEPPVVRAPRVLCADLAGTAPGWLGRGQTLPQRLVWAGRARRSSSTRRRNTQQRRRGSTPAAAAAAAGAARTTSPRPRNRSSSCSQTARNLASTAAIGRSPRGSATPRAGVCAVGAAAAAATCVRARVRERACVSGSGCHAASAHTPVPGARCPAALRAAGMCAMWRGGWSTCAA
jgi:hypothetical protein